jgi:hypothetical protein
MCKSASLALQQYLLDIRSAIDAGALVVTGGMVMAP